MTNDSATTAGRIRSVCLFLCSISLLTACNSKKEGQRQDIPRLTPGVAMRDVTFHSAALDRDMQYRAILPAGVKSGEKLPVVYLLHGSDGDFRDWSDYSSVARFAEHGLILVMPQGDSSYYTNATDRPQDLYEDYLVTDLINDVEARLPAAPGRAERAIVGVSMGGYGAIKLALKHPDLYVFAGGLSSALDVPSRPFSIKRISQWRYHRSIFGPWGGEAQRRNDPYVLARSADPANTPYIFLTCGEQEGLLPANRKFAALLTKRGFQYEFHTARGGHTWTQWETWLDACFQGMLRQVEHPAAEKSQPAGTGH